MSMVISGDNGLTFPAGSTQVQAGNYQSMVNRIINGRMEIDQRNAGASVTLGNTTTAGNYVSYTLDRYEAQNFTTTAGTGVAFSVQQNAGSVTPPTGFTNYLGATVTTSRASLSATTICRIQQRIEGFNVADLGWGTANAQTVTLSFWVRSSLTGTFGGVLGNSAGTQVYPFSYTISSANTWEYKTITVAGSTTGTWLTTNGNGLSIQFSLGADSASLGTAGAWTGTNPVGVTGQTNLVSTNGATFYITGVDLRVGSYTVVPQDFRAYGTELQLCYRYFQKFLGTSSYEALPAYVISNSAGTNAEGFITHKTTMRAAPTLSTSTLCAVDPASTFAFTGSSMLNAGLDSSRINLTGASGMTGFRSYYVTANNSTSAFLTLSSEL